MTPRTTLTFPEGGSAQPLWFKTFPDEEFSTIVKMSNDERGLFTSLRWYALTSGGFSTDLEECWKEARNFCGISRFKFRKLFHSVVKYFTEVEGVFCFERDEERVSESRLNVAKARRSAQLAAQARWDAMKQKVPDPVPISDAPAYANQPTNQSSGVDIVGEPPPPTNIRELGELAEAVGGGGPTQTAENTETEGYQEFISHCKHKGLSPGTRVLWDRIRAKFPGSSTEHVLENLPKFDDQYSPGMWDHHSQQALFEESRRIKPDRKPAARKSKTELMLEETARKMGITR